MAQQRFYKKLSPATDVILAGNERVRFDTLDNLVGYFHSDNEYVQSELARLMQEQRYGMSEISQDEFHADYVTPKKNPGSQPLKPAWREEWGKGSKSSSPIQELGPERVAAVVGLDAPDLKRKPAVAAFGEPAAVADVPTTVPAKPKQDFKPTLGKRKVPQKPPSGPGGVTAHD